MARVDLTGVHIVTAKGRHYHYAWRGGPRLTAEPGSQAYVDELATAHRARKGGDPGKISGLIVEWKRSDAWTQPPEKGGLAPSTKKAWTRKLDAIQTHFGTLSIKQFDRPEIRVDIKKWRGKWKATPRGADMAKQVLSALLSFAVEEGKLTANPCFGLANLYQNDRSEIIWTDDDIARLEAVASKEIVWALKLAALTGLRQGDLLKLCWSHVGDLSIELRTGKSGRKKRVAIVPLYQDLRDLLAEIPQRSTSILTNSKGQPWRGFSSSWTKAVEDMGEEVLHFHDARGTFATKIYLAGFSHREIAEMLGWSEDKVERIINRYVRRDAQLRDKIRRLDEARKKAEGNS